MSLAWAGRGVLRNARAGVLPAPSDTLTALHRVPGSLCSIDAAAARRHGCVAALASTRMLFRPAAGTFPHHHHGTSGLTPRGRLLRGADARGSRGRGEASRRSQWASTRKRWMAAAAKLAEKPLGDAKPAEKAVFLGHLGYILATAGCKSHFSSIWPPCPFKGRHCNS